ncbi:MAG TPA: Uma2 family endonuclease [Gemmataceae bacterium]|nr:Uma2 family endonuclease [Gemmataceae bacterium]
MATVEQRVPPLTAGDRLTREDFLRTWEMHPEIKLAELIGGIVYMPSPLYADHGETDGDLGFWLGYYKTHTRGTIFGHNTTSFILEDAPQPDDNLRILPEYGGGSWIEDRCLAGIPELFAEICRSAASYDLHQKMDLYEAAKIPEYLAVLLFEKEIRWHRLVDGVYQLMPPDADGIWRSQVFPGLWLDGAALLAGDTVRVLAKLQEGLASPEHQAFVEKLAQARQSRGS